MKMMAKVGGLAVALTIGAVPAANAAKDKVYILSGYTFGGFEGLNTDELTARLKDKPGARITGKDIAADAAMISTELKARNIEGRLMTSLAEKHGRVWLVFDLQKTHPGMTYFNKPLKAQAFEGATRIKAGDLTAATGLKPGDTLSFAKIKTARQSLVDLYAKVTPGKAPSIRSRMQTTADGQVTLTWLIGEP